jgi:hypothetical protein
MKTRFDNGVRYMQSVSGLAAITLAILLGATTIAHAHHSFAAVFDENKPVKLQGVVTKLEWMNPHIWFYLDVKDDKGAITKWQCEGGNPNTLLRQGWTRNTLQIGTTVDIEGWLARNGTNTCNARTVMANGKRLFAGSSFGQ